MGTARSVMKTELCPFVRFGEATTQRLDFDKSEKTLHKSIKNLTKRFKHNVDQQKKRIR